MARSTFPGQNVQNTTCTNHFWMLRCRKQCMPLWHKHISKSKVSKTDVFEPLLEGQISKKCTSLPRETQFQVKCVKNDDFGPLLEVQMSFGVARAADCASCQNSAKRGGSLAVSNTITTTSQLHYATPHYPPYMMLHYIPLTSLHHTTLHYTALHYTTLHHTTLHHTTPHYTTARHTTRHHTTPHHTTPNHTTSHHTTI